MAYVLSLMPHSPLGTLYSERSYERSWSSLGSTGTVHRHHSRQLSVGSLASAAASLYATPWRSTDHGLTTPLRSTSYSDLYTGPPPPPTFHRRRTSSGRSRPKSVPPSTSHLALSDTPSENGSEAELYKPSLSPKRELSALDLVDEEGGDTEADNGLIESTMWHPAIEDIPDESEDSALESSQDTARTGPRQPFERWMSTLRRKKLMYKRRGRPKLDALLVPPTSPSVTMVSGRPTTRHQKSESWTSSINFVTAVKSATITVASASIAPLSRSGSSRPKLFRGNSGLLEAEARFSTDSARPSFAAVIDEAARQRGRKRREKIEELIKTEEGYISDLKALSNAYFTLLPPFTPHTAHTRTSARTNVANILQLHDEILEELHRVVPFSENDQATNGQPSVKRRPIHARWHSEDAVPVRKPPYENSHSGWSNRCSLDIHRAAAPEPLSLSCTTTTAAEVARVFAKNMKRFALYEEYGARCEMMQEDIDLTQKTTFSASDYDKAIETLSASLNPVRSREANRKKALSIKDLLIKPIQRITRYELLFKDLCRLTPSCDDPTSHSVLDDVLYRLGETCRNVDEAKDDPEKLRLLNIGWLLQDRLIFQDKISRTQLFQRLGRLSLCGTLYTAYRTRNSIQGCYMVCVLFESCLLFAQADRHSKYKVVVGTSLASTSIEESDNGKGLQCHTAPHTWKIVFESGGKMYEMIMAACSAAEGSVWRDRLSGRIAIESQHLAEGHSPAVDIQSPLTRDLRSIGKAYGKARGFSRRLSVHRTATLGPMSDLNQVIIKHTAAPKDDSTNSSTSSLPVGRSQSVISSSHVPTLAPMRTERIKLEAALADVWTKDAIPYPAMGSRRTEHVLRDTANDLIRKLSMASIASNFSRRSMSYTNVHNAYPPMDKYMKAKAMPRAEPPKPRRPPLVNFHNAPDAFLPEDFELQDPSSKRSRKLGLRTLTMTDRPRSPFFFSENKTPEIKRAKSSAQARPPVKDEAAPVSEISGGELRTRKDSMTPLQSTNSSSNAQPNGVKREMRVGEGEAMRKKQRPKLFKYFTGKT